MINSIITVIANTNNSGMVAPENSCATYCILVWRVEQSIVSCKNWVKVTFVFNFTTVLPRKILLFLHFTVKWLRRYNWSYMMKLYLFCEPSSSYKDAIRANCSTKTLLRDVWTYRIALFYHSDVLITFKNIIVKRCGSFIANLILSLAGYYQVLYSRSICIYLHNLLIEMNSCLDCK